MTIDVEGWMGIELFKLGRSSTDTICMLTSSAIELKDEPAVEELFHANASRVRVDYETSLWLGFDEDVVEEVLAERAYRRSRRRNSW